MTYEELVRRDTKVLLSVLKKMAILRSHTHKRKPSLSDVVEIENEIIAREGGKRFDENRMPGPDKGESL